MSKYIVAARTTDDNPTASDADPSVRPPIEMEITTPFETSEKAAAWIETILSEKPHLLDMSQYRPGRKFEIGIKEIAD